jgi:hypothetical protein
MPESQLQSIRKCVRRFKRYLRSLARPSISAILLLWRLYTRRTRFSYGRGRLRKTLWLPASKPSRKGTQSRSHRFPANSSARLSRFIQLATTCPLPRKIVKERYGPVTKHGSAFVTPILGRSAWNTLIDPAGGNGEIVPKTRLDTRETSLQHLEKPVVLLS